MGVRIVAAVLAVSAATGVSAQLVRGVVSGSASAASRGGVGAVDPDPGSLDPTPSIVGGGTTDGDHVVRVSAGARVQATRETRCYDGTDYWDPSYGADGRYYCETSGPGVAAGARVRTPR